MPYRSSFKLTLLDGYVREGIDVNAAQQLYYTFDIGLYREFRDAYESSYNQSSIDLACFFNLVRHRADFCFIREVFWVNYW